MALETQIFDAAELLTDDESRLEYLRQSFASGDPAEIAEGLGTVARAIGMSRIAAEAGLARPALYRALAEDGNPALATVARVLATMGLRLSVEAIAAAERGGVGNSDDPISSLPA
ncbi:putative addiction module antidote protein [bacterium]|nr:putative addiction module antidote protein [bacterium]